MAKIKFGVKSLKDFILQAQQQKALTLFSNNLLIENPKNIKESLVLIWDVLKEMKSKTHAEFPFPSYPTIPKKVT